MMIPTFDTREFDRYFVPLVVPFRADSLEVDEDAFRDLVRTFTQNEQFIDIGGALIVNPEAGEVFYLTPAEQARLVEIAVDERPAGMPVFAGAFGLTVEDTLTSAVQAKQLGADGLFVLPPVGTMEVGVAMDGERSPEIWTDHCRPIAELTQLPLIIHPSHPYTREWASSLPLKTVETLLTEIPSIVGYKLIYGHAEIQFRVARRIRELPRHVSLLNAPVEGFHTALLTDLVDGMVNGTLNFNFEGWTEHAVAWRAGDMARVREIWNANIVPVQAVIMTDYARLHVRYKLAAFARGLIAHPFMRPPMPPPRIDEAKHVLGGMIAAGIECISEAELHEVFARKDSILATYTDAATGAAAAREHQS
jgi:4-hydroxy-tetrahydrodipicolinate synthase